MIPVVGFMEMTAKVPWKPYFCAKNHGKKDTHPDNGSA